MQEVHTSTHAGVYKAKTVAPLRLSGAPSAKCPWTDSHNSTRPSCSWTLGSPSQEEESSPRPVSGRTSRSGLLHPSPIRGQTARRYRQTCFLSHFSVDGLSRLPEPV